MIEGDATTSLVEPHSIVLTESVAKKYYNDESALGKSVRMNNEEYKVTGVVRDLPPNTHLNFEVLLAFAEKDFVTNDWHWRNFLTYIKVREGTDVTQLQSKFNKFIEAHYPEETNQADHTSLDLQPIRDIHLNSHLALEIKDNGNARSVYFVGLLGVLILVIAWINYINLSTAKAIETSEGSWPSEGRRRRPVATHQSIHFGFFVDQCRRANHRCCARPCCIAFLRGSYFSSDHNDRERISHHRSI